MLMTLYYYICDSCGTIADISEGPHDPDGPTWACAECGSEALWEFTDQEKAMTHAFHIMDKRFAAQMAQLDQALAALDEAEGKR